MKELSIEEKAKRYDELKVTAQELEHDGCFDKITLFDLFPELKESEDERIRKVLVGWIKCEPLSSFEKGFSQEQILAWLEKQGEQKPAWSEEDKHWRQKAIDFMKHPDLIKATPTLAKDTIDWLKSLKDKVPPQPKQEWSVDDERTYRSVLYDFEHRFPLNCVQQEFVKSHIQPQNKWKPGDEQMEALKEAVDAEIVEVEDNDNSMCAHTHLEICVDEDLSKICKAGDKAKVIIIKQK